MYDTPFPTVRGCTIVAKTKKSTRKVLSSAAAAAACCLALSRSDYAFFPLTFRSITTNDISPLPPFDFGSVLYYSPSSINASPSSYFSSFTSPSSPYTRTTAPSSAFSFSSSPFSFVVGAAAVATPSSSSSVDPVYYYIGYLRMTALDSPNLLAGYQATLDYANTQNMYTQLFTYRLNVTTVECDTVAACRSLTAAQEAQVDEFLFRMKYFQAVLRPNHLLSSRVVSAAAAKGSIPVINPQSLDDAHYTSAYPNVINFNLDRVGTADHLFTHMQHTASCAVSGIFHGNDAEGAEMDNRLMIIAHIRSLFTAGGMAEPPALNIATATDDELKRFVFAENPNRACFIVLTAHATFMSTLRRLGAMPGYPVDSARYYLFPTAAADRFLLDGSTALTHNVRWVHWAPLEVPSTLTTAFAQWRATIAATTNVTALSTNTNSSSSSDDDEEHNYAARFHEDFSPSLEVSSGLMPTEITFATVESYFLMRMLMESLQTAMVRNSTYAGLLITSGGGRAFVTETYNGVAYTFPTCRLSPSQAIGILYAASPTIDAFPFKTLTQSCPPLPFDQSICFCNIVSKTSYVYGVAEGTGNPVAVYDNSDYGEKDSASITFGTECGYRASSWSYPLSSSIVFSENPSTFDFGTAISNASAENFVWLTRGLFKSMATNENYATTRKPRMVRLQEISVDTRGSRSTQEVVEANGKGLKPFIVFTSAAGGLDFSDVMTLVPSVNEMMVEDAPLLPHGTREQVLRGEAWNENLLQMMPTLADTIHTLCAFYAYRMRDYTHYNTKELFSTSTARTSARTLVKPFSSIHLMASTRREAELIVLSMASWGYVVDVESIAIVSDSATWLSKITRWLSAATPIELFNYRTGKTDTIQANPFIMCVTALNPKQLTQTTAKALHDLFKLSAPQGTVAFGTAVFWMQDTAETVKATSFPTVTNNGDEFDIMFACAVSEWWLMPAAIVAPEFQDQISHPMIIAAVACITLAQILSDNAQYDYTASASKILYQLGTMSGAGVTFGPFSNASCSAEQIAANTRDRMCQCNKGCRQLYINSLYDMMMKTTSDRGGWFSWSMPTCGVSYAAYVAPPADDSLSSGAIAGIVVGCAVAFFGITALWLVVSLCCLGRNNSAAPKDAGKPFAIVFTDVQASTALWARCPVAMSEAIDQHHRLIRKLIKSNDGYEVKTVGDSFMVAFKDMDDAAAFAMACQEAFFAARWSDEIDATYIELLAEAEALAERNNNGGGVAAADKLGSGGAAKSEELSSNNYNAMTSLGSAGDVGKGGGGGGAVGIAISPPEVVVAQQHHHHKATHQTNTAYWHGIRVRIGVHHGMGDIRKDPISHGFDYYGTVVNVAARVEGVGHGGQTLLTEEAYLHISDSYIRRLTTAGNSEHCVIIDLGMQPLRGLDAPLRLYQFVPESLKHRRFPGLRLHIQKESAEAGDDTTDTSGAPTGTGFVINGSQNNSSNNQQQHNNNGGDNNSNNSATNPRNVISRLFQTSKQYGSITQEEVLYNYYLLHTSFGPFPAKSHVNVLVKLAESWGMDVGAARASAQQVVQSSNGTDVHANRMAISLVAKITKSFAIAHPTIRMHRLLQQQQQLQQQQNNNATTQQQLQQQRSAGGSSHQFLLSGGGPSSNQYHFRGQPSVYNASKGNNTNNVSGGGGRDGRDVSIGRDISVGDGEEGPPTFSRGSEMFGPLSAVPNGHVAANSNTGGGGETRDPNAVGSIAGASMSSLDN